MVSSFCFKLHAIKLLIVPSKCLCVESGNNIIGSNTLKVNSNFKKFHAITLLDNTYSAVIIFYGKEAIVLWFWIEEKSKE